MAAQDISACQSNNPCESAWVAAYTYAADQQYELALYQAAQTLAFGVLQYTSADRTTDKQYDIADRQMKIAEEEYARYKTNYVPCEDALNEEICALELPETDYQTYANRAQADVVREFSSARSKLTRLKSRYCISDYITSNCELNVEQAKAVTRARNIAYRFAESVQDKYDERRWSRKTNMLTHGRNIKSDSSSQYSNGMGYAISALGAKQDAFSNLLGGISGGIGTMLNAYYYPQISAPSAFGISGQSRFQTAWGPFQNGTLTRNGVSM